MTLSNNKVINLLRRNFVCGWKNISGAHYAGTSNKHMPNLPARTVSNCSGHHNIQMFFMTSDAKVVNCLPGFWDTKYFLNEAKLAVKLNKIYKSNMSIVRRNNKFLDLHLEKAFYASNSLKSSSHLQGFDKKNIERRGKSDFKREEGFKQGLKTTDQVVHERMAERPFLPFALFDTPKFVDMGRKKYKYNYGMPGHERMGKRRGKRRKK